MRASSILQSIERFLNNILGAILLLGMMFLVVADVTGRYLFNRPVHGTMEITTFIMVGLVYFTLAHTQAIKAHIKVELVFERLSIRGKAILQFITCLIGMTIFALITWQGVRLALDAWKYKEYTDGLIPFPTFPAKLAIPVGCFIFCLRFIVDIISSLRSMTGKDKT